MKDMDDPKLQERLLKDMRYKIASRQSTCTIPQLLPEPIDSMVKEHFAEGGDGFKAGNSIYSIVQLGTLKRTEA